MFAELERHVEIGKETVHTLMSNQPSPIAHNVNYLHLRVKYYYKDCHANLVNTVVQLTQRLKLTKHKKKFLTCIRYASHECF